MIGRKEELNLQFLQIVDALLLAIAFWAAHTLRFLAVEWFFFDKPIGPFREFQWLLFIILPFGPILLELQGFYAHPLQKAMGKSIEQIVRAFVWLGLMVAACGFFLKLEVPSRAVMPLFLIFAGITLLVREQFTLRRLRTRMKRQELREPIILIGTPEDTRLFRETFTPEQSMEIEVVQEIDLATEGVEALVAALHRHSVSRVVFAGDHTQVHVLREGIAACETEGVEAWMIADFIRPSIARPSFDVFGARPMIVFRTTPELSWELLLKEAIDRTGALIGLMVAAVPMLIIAVVIRLTSPGPIIFRQSRGGKNGRPFMMYKFRTMQTDAEMRQAELAAFNQMSGPVFKIERDPRITPVGGFLRKTSLDELPQLFNVLRGDMSLVGPRPLPIYEVEKFESTAQRRRLSMKPGLTCLWQISGRNQISSFSDWVKLDLRYIDNWSLWLDVKILVKTIPVVLFGWGAK